MITGADFKLMIIHSILIPVMVTMMCMTPLHIAMADKVVYQGNITSKQNREFFKRMQGKTVGHLVISSTAVKLRQELNWACGYSGKNSPFKSATAAFLPVQIMFFLRP